MRKCHRNYAITAGLTLIIAFSVGGYILGFGLGEQSGEHQANTDTYARHAQDEIDSTCAGLDGAAQTECIVRVVEATNQHERSESDLQAQRNMARWALLMLLATVAMAVITAFGVYYVWRTLQATQKMAADTREIGEAQVSAQLMPVDRLANLVNMGNGVSFSGKFKIRNVGSTPAYRVSVSATVDGFVKKEWAESTPYDIGPNEEAVAQIYGEGGPNSVVDADSGYKMSVHVRFDTVFTRGPNSLKRKSNRFDYRITRNLQGGYEAKRL
ncbi:hypothetical protein [uncultured Ruegeria sp.]|uniref:hypothetical protein n=1 Tax=uncultured Ruegeria sp. TaxID=259304 RepID=UPI0026143B6B|nr:hypothetical protein [uncultured Ruegeria sp.]